MMVLKASFTKFKTYKLTCFLADSLLLEVVGEEGIAAAASVESFLFLVPDGDSSSGSG